MKTLKVAKEEGIGRMYTILNFKKVFRPADGLARGIIKNLDTGEEKEIFNTSKVVCDVCGAEITQPLNKPNEPVVYVFNDSNADALCSRCGEERITELSMAYFFNGNIERDGKVE